MTVAQLVRVPACEAGCCGFESRQSPQMKKQTSQTLKGFRDFLPQTMAIRNYVKNLFVEIFENSGFQPLETPSLEYASTLMGKYSQEADKLIYSFKDRGNRQIGLRYDLTVPTAKVLALYPNQIPLPFKRYQIQPVWRADKPQKGRYREILQCDIDIFGPKSAVNDAEIIFIIYQVLKRLNFKKYSIRINSRQVLNEILDNAGIKKNQNTVLQSLDKLQKINKDGVTKELIKKGLNKPQINKIFTAIQKAKPDKYLQQVFQRLDQNDTPKTAYTFDPTMVRGLDYYTGPIFETYVEQPKIGSITGGGRYDNLISQLNGPDISAVGTTIGLDRIVDCIQALNLLPQISSTKTKVLVANFSQKLTKPALQLVSQLQNKQIASYLYPTTDKVGKQIKYATKLNIPYFAIIGPDEAKANKITLKNLKTQKQQTLTVQQLISLFNPKTKK